MASQSVKFNFLSRADGSALYSLGNTVVLASVIGPVASRPNSRLHNKCSLEVQFNPRNGQPMVSERNVESIIRESVQHVLASHLHPRTTLLLNIQEMQSEHQHQLLSASINAACLALLNAATQLKSLVAAVSCCYTQMGVVIVEPSSLDLIGSKSMLTVVVESEHLGVVSCHQEGSLAAHEYAACIRRCQEAASEVFLFFRKQVELQYDLQREEEQPMQREEEHEQFEPV